MRWLRGARLVDGYQHGSTYVFKTSTNKYILWNTHTNGELVQLPSTWAVTKSRNLQGATATLPSSKQILLGLEPVLLEP